MSTGLLKAIALKGGVTHLANEIGVSAQVVSNWRTRGVPAEQCPLIERVTDGVVRCEDLRPDVDWGVLREGTHG